MQIFHSVNAGLYLKNGKTSLLVDGIPSSANTGFSPMPEEFRRDIETCTGAFAYLSGLLFTHLHPDHFDPHWMDKIRSYPHPPLSYGPGFKTYNAPTQFVSPDLERMVIGSFSVSAVKTAHEGSVFTDVQHRVFLIHCGGKGVFIAGDAILGEREAALIQQENQQITAAFLNPYQLLSLQGHSFLKRLEPESVYLYHLPLLEHDWLGCYTLAKQAEQQYPSDLPPLKRLLPMAWIQRNF